MEMEKNDGISTKPWQFYQAWFMKYFQPFQGFPISLKNFSFSVSQALNFLINNNYQHRFKCCTTVKLTLEWE